MLSVGKTSPSPKNIQAPLETTNKGVSTSHVQVKASLTLVRLRTAAARWIKSPPPPSSVRTDFRIFLPLLLLLASARPRLRPLLLRQTPRIRLGLGGRRGVVAPRPMRDGSDAFPAVANLALRRRRRKRVLLSRHRGGGVDISRLRTRQRRQCHMKDKVGMNGSPSFTAYNSEKRQHQHQTASSSRRGKYGSCQPTSTHLVLESSPKPCSARRVRWPR